MVVIRLARTGKKKQAFYRIVVADSQRAVTAKFIEIVGWFNPHSKEIDLKKDLIAEWLGKGAVPSNSVAILLKKEGIKLPDWVKIKEKVTKPKSEPKEEPKAEALATKEEAVVEETESEVAEEVTEEKAPEVEESTEEETVETETPAE